MKSASAEPSAIIGIIVVVALMHVYSYLNDGLGHEMVTTVCEDLAKHSDLRTRSLVWNVIHTHACSELTERRR